MTTSASLLRSVSYFSYSVETPSEERLRKLFVSASDYNDQVNVTGLLLFADGIFLQTFEGQFDDVERVWERIKGDSLHRIEKVFTEQDVERRMYPAWAMMSNLATPNPTLLTFLQSRKESSTAGFSDTQISALDRTIRFIERRDSSVLTG